MTATHYTCPGCNGMTESAETMRRHQLGCVAFLRAERGRLEKRCTDLERAASEAQGALEKAAEAARSILYNARQMGRNSSEWSISWHDIERTQTALEAIKAVLSGSEGEEGRDAES